MKAIDINECKVHVLVCTNDRPAPRTGCAQFGGQEFYLKIKNRLKDTGLSASIWATRTGCLGFCNNTGTVVAIRKTGQEPKWFEGVTEQDFDTIWKEITS